MHLYRFNTVPAKISLWLHTTNYCEFTPAEFIEYVAKAFIKDVKQFRLSIDVSEAQFIKSMCQAMCTHYHASLTYRSSSGPNRDFFYPSGWNAVCESCWQELIADTYFTTDYWEAFWGEPEFRDLPDFFMDIQPYLAAIMPFYVRRSVDVLLHKELIVETYERTFIRWEDAVPEEENEYEPVQHKTRKQKKLQNDTNS